MLSISLFVLPPFPIPQLFTLWRRDIKDSPSFQERVMSVRKRDEPSVTAKEKRTEQKEKIYIYIYTGFSFPPAQRNSWYVVRSDIDGASPESSHSTCSTVPPAMLAPAAGLVNLTSASTARGPQQQRRSSTANCASSRTDGRCHRRNCRDTSGSSIGMVKGEI